MKLRVSICQMQKGSESLIVLTINWVAGNWGSIFQIDKKKKKKKKKWKKTEKKEK